MRERLMQKKTLATGILVFGIIVAWVYMRYVYAPTPSEVYAAAMESAWEGDEESFVSYFTDDSQARLRGLFAISKDHARSEIQPYAHLVNFSVIKEEIEGDKAVLTIQGVSSRHAFRRQVGTLSAKSDEGEQTILLRRENGRWRIDLFENQ